MKKAFLFLFLFACSYTTPPRDEWSAILRGSSSEQLSPTLRVAKKPLYQDAGGLVISAGKVRGYMDALDAKLNDTLRKPGIQINRIGTDIVVILVRSSFIYTDSPEISRMGDDVLGLLADVLNEYNMTWIEITGYSDAIRNQSNAVAFSRDMAQRAAIYLARHNVKPIRMFIVGRGSANPIADQSDLGRLMNRRVEIRLSAVN
jgi:outer membrane protein OmpA-like peptidoglycan-associated protein